MARQRRERLLIRADGTLLTQEDPLDHPEEEITVRLGEEEVRFRYDMSTVEEDEHGREVIVTWYDEIEGDDGHIS